MAAGNGATNFTESFRQKDGLSESNTMLYYVLVNGAIAVVVFFSLALFNGFLRHYLQYPGAPKSNVCKSPNCIRCKSSHLKTDLLLDRLEEFIDKKSIKPETVERVFESLINACKNSDCVRQRPTTFGLLGLSSKPWHENMYMSELENLMENIQGIRKEAIQISEDLSCGWVQNTSPTGCWYVYHLYNQGTKVHKNCTVCPFTLNLVESIGPFMKDCAFGNAVISLIKPGTHITAHYGPTNCRLRCQIPLMIPADCSITVDLEKKQWQDSKPLIFDDSYLHEVTHNGCKGDRIVLILDLWHPEVTAIEREAINFVFSNVTFSI